MANKQSDLVLARFLIDLATNDATRAAFNANAAATVNDFSTAGFKLDEAAKAALLKQAPANPESFLFLKLHLSNQNAGPADAKATAKKAAAGKAKAAKKAKPKKPNKK